MDKAMGMLITSLQKLVTKVQMKTIQKISRQNEFRAGKTCGWQLLPFQHILKQSEKFKFSEMALRFAVKVKLSTFTFTFLYKIMTGTVQAVVRLTAVNSNPPQRSNTKNNVTVGFSEP